MVQGLWEVGRKEGKKGGREEGSFIIAKFLLNYFITNTLGHKLNFKSNPDPTG
jgi:hypothetical protein